MFTVRRRGAEEKIPGNDFVDLAGIRGAESPVEWKAQELALFVADEGHRLLEGIDRLNGAADDALHGSEGVVNDAFSRRLTWRY